MLRHIGYHARLHPVVAVHKAQIFPRALTHASFPCGNQTAVFLVNYPDSLIAACKSVAQLPAFVRGAVVHQQDFQIVIVLADKGVHTLCQILFRIINRNNHADLIFSHVLPHLHFFHCTGSLIWSPVPQVPPIWSATESSYPGSATSRQYIQGHT